MCGPGDEEEYDYDEQFRDRDEYYEEDEDEPEYDDEYDSRDYGDLDDDYSVFADPGGESALRAETPDNPRNLPCPTCDSPNRLTPADVAHGYQCDSCARQDELGY